MLKRLVSMLALLTVAVSATAQFTDSLDPFNKGAVCIPCGTIKTNILAYYKFDEASGTRVDSVAGTYNLFPTNTPGNAAGKVGNALSLVKASSQFLDSGGATLPITGTDWSYFGWFQINTGGFNQRLWIVSGGTTNVFMEMAVANTVRVSIASTSVVVSVSAISIGAFHSACVRFRTSDKFTELSVDGATFVTATAAQSPTTGKLWIGQNAGGGGFWDGRQDASGFWNKRLTDAECAYLANGTNGREIY